MILGGDIGGTNARLALFAVEEGRVNPVVRKIYPSRTVDQFSEILEQFLGEFPESVRGCCLGIAGPVRGGRCVVTNLPWTVDADALSRQFSVGTVTLINDLVANAYGIDLLSDDDVLTVSAGMEEAEANRAVIAAGTGLGEAGIIWDGRRHIPFATEGGHCDFGPRTPEQYDLARYLQTKMEHISYERILCGDGLCHIYDFLNSKAASQPSEKLMAIFDEKGKAATISELGVAGNSVVCQQALELFLEIYGQEASNLALKALALGGVYLGGGIAAQLAQSIRDNGAFMKGFRNKGKMTDLVSDIPVKVLLNPDTALLGAAAHGASLLK